MTEHQLLIFLLEILIILGVGRVLGEIFRRFGQPAVVGEILTGITLGPSILGRFLPEVYHLIFPPEPIYSNMLNTIAYLGVLLLLLATGLEVDFSTAWRERGVALRIAFIGVFTPLVIGFLFALNLPEQLSGTTDRLIFALFVGTAIAISAIPIISRLLHDLNLLKTDLGLLILSAFALNDLLGWIIFTIVLGMEARHLNPGRIITVLTATITISVVCLSLGRRVTDQVISRLKASYPAHPGIILTFIFCLGLGLGATTQTIGIHAIFGFFLAGIMVGGARDLSERTRQVINQMVYAIFVPIFFASIGLRLDFVANFNLPLVLAITAIAILGKLIGAWLGTMGSDLSSEDRYAVAIAHTPGGAMEVVIAVVALQFGLITPHIFVAIVFAAISSSILIGPWFKWAIERRKVVNLLDFFLDRATISDLKSRDRDGAIKEIAASLSEQEQMPEANLISEAVLSRESLMGTGLEQGIAIPHARIPHISRPAFALARAKEGIDWDCRDGKPARLIIFLVTPVKEAGLQVPILATLVRIMREQTNYRTMINAGDEDLVKIFADILRSKGKVIRKQSA
ncbi:MAG TPA: hypothetical protein EYP24_05010 [bacterium (Candidatus Stahlbacteria)]|nr:hypothetical protein [Candidatus Stahlbacteria bacterium]